MRHGDKITPGSIQPGMGRDMSYMQHHDTCVDPAAAIKADLDEARALREEAKSILATYERRQKEVQEQADRIVSSAKEEAMAAAAQAKADLKASIARRLAAATDQIASAEAAAIRQVREQAVAVAIAAAGDVLPLDDGDVVAATGEVAGGGEAGETGPDDDDGAHARAGDGVVMRVGCSSSGGVGRGRGPLTGRARRSGGPSG